MLYIFHIILAFLLVFSGTANAAQRYQDEGTVQGFAWDVDCVGAGIACSVAASKLTITVSGGGGATFITQEDDSTVDSSTGTLDFGTGFDVTSSPAGEANVSLDFSETAPTYDQIGDPGANSTIAFAGNTNTWTTTLTTSDWFKLTGTSLTTGNGLLITGDMSMTTGNAIEVQGGASADKEVFTVFPSINQVGNVTNATSLDAVNRIWVSGGYLYAVAYAASNDYVTIVDVTEPTAPAIVGTLTTGISDPDALAVAGRYAYIGEGSTANEFTVVDIANANAPSITGTVADATNLNTINEIFIRGNYAYVVASSSDRFTIVDISDPANPTVTGSVTDATALDLAHSVYVVGDYAFVPATNTDRFAVIDITDPTSPSVTTSITDGVANELDGVNDCEIRGRYAYCCAEFGDALTIIDIEDPTTPVITGTVTDTTLDGADGIHLLGNFAIVSSTVGDDLTLVDITDPANPSVEGSVAVDGDDVFCSGNYCYVANEADDSIKIYEVVGVQTPAITTGDIETGWLHVEQNADIGHNMYIRNGLNVGEDSMFNGNVTTDGTFRTLVGFYGIGAIDMDYGSADITDHTFTTDGTGTSEIVLPAGSIDSTEILDDTIDSADYAAGSVDLEHMSSASVDSDNIVNDTIVAADVDETGQYDFAVVAGKQDRAGTAIDDDDCTGEQSSWWWDSTDTQFEFCNANSGAPATIGGGGGGAFSDSADPIVQNTTTKDVHVGDGAGTLAGKLEVGGDADQPQLVVEGHSTQTDSIVVIQNDADAEVLTIDASGLISSLVGFDCIGNVDCDFGSADVDDFTFTTDGTGDAEIVLPDGSIGTTEILDDTIGTADIDETAAYTWSGASLITGVHEVADDIDFNIGTDADWSMQYDEGVDNQLIFETTATSAVATTDPMFEILVGTTPTADQQVFGVAKGTQASNTALLTVDEDGDTVANGSITAGGSTAGIVLGGETADPCATLGEGAIFYNTTSNYMCYCDGTNDLKMNDNTTACF